MSMEHFDFLTIFYCSFIASRKGSQNQ